MIRHFHYYGFSQMVVDDAIALVFDSYDRFEQEGVIHGFLHLLHKSGGIPPVETPEQIASSIKLSLTSRIPFGMTMADLECASQMVITGINSGRREAGMIEAFEYLTEKSGAKLPPRDEEGHRIDTTNLNNFLKRVSECRISES